MAHNWYTSSLLQAIGELKIEFIAYWSLLEPSWAEISPQAISKSFHTELSAEVDEARARNSEALRSYLRCASLDQKSSMAMLVWMSWRKSNPRNLWAHKYLYTCDVQEENARRGANDGASVGHECEDAVAPERRITLLSQHQIYLRSSFDASKVMRRSGATTIAASNLARKQSLIRHFIPPSPHPPQ